MNAKSPHSPRSWADPDDAPELTKEFFENGDWKMGGQPVDPHSGAAALSRAVARGRPPSESPKLALTVRYDADVISAFRATGKGWQTRMNDALREWLEQNRHSQ
jgi:uncharacterized protein (DUF4415 family)